jgi:hypothetical protein
VVSLSNWKPPRLCRRNGVLLSIQNPCEYQNLICLDVRANHRQLHAIAENIRSLVNARQANQVVERQLDSRTMVRISELGKKWWGVGGSNARPPD